MDTNYIDSALREKLRECQAESIIKALSYLDEYQVDERVKSCLISLPTGAGKSGVISVISHLAKKNKILVLSHRRAVCNQLYNDIRGGFFRKIKLADHINMKKVFDQVDNTECSGIYVTTFQKIQQLQLHQLDALKNSFDLIIVDEGHSEPSPIWSSLVRGGMAYKIVITATPYRNDLFQFDIAAEFSYIYTFVKACSDGIVKEPIFERIKPSGLISCIGSFLQANPGAKCIIKCKTFSDVESYYKILSDSFKVIAIHDQYARSDSTNLKSSVPKDLECSEYEVIIHQRKLDEGIDLPSAKLLVLTYNVSSGRELVQTVGRVVRIYGDVTPKVFEFEGDTNYKLWRNYEKFDASLNGAEAVRKFIASLDASKLIEQYLDAFPESSYYEKNFLQRFDLNSITPSDSIKIPTASICFLRTLEGFTESAMLDALYWQSNSNGELAKSFVSSNGFYIIIAIAFNKSRFLRDKFFFEPSLELTVFKEVAGSILAIFDSRSRRFNNEKKLKIGTAISQEELMRVLSKGKSVRTKQVGSKAIGTTKRRPENVSMKGRELDKIVNLQSNSSYRLSNVKLDLLDDSNEKSGSYYVGFDSGRISDQFESEFDLDSLGQWLEDMSNTLSCEASLQSELIDSYAKPIAISEDVKIESLILDFSDDEYDIKILVNGHELMLDNNFIFKVYNDGFLVNDNCPDSKVSMKYCSENSCFIFESKQKFYSGDGDELDLDKFFGDKVHKVLLEGGVTYSNGNFYQSALPLKTAMVLDETNLSKIIVSINDLQGEKLDEKGHVTKKIDGKEERFYKVVDQDFSEDSVFYLIDKLKSNGCENPTKSELGPFYNYIPGVDLLINTDMDTEPADFIVSSKDKLVFVHVKCGDSTRHPRSSAGAIAEVGSQAIKNIEMLISADNELKPGNWSILHDPWPNSNATPKMNDRVRLFEGRNFCSVSEDARKEILESVWDVIATRRRSSLVRKEIWLVVANSFSRTHFSSKLANIGKDKKTASETLQAFQLIASWVSTANENDVDFRIFVSP